MARRQPPKQDAALPPFVAFDKALFDAMMAGRFTANEYKLLLAVVRFTLGHNDHREGARISRRWIARVTDLHERTVRTVLASLTQQGVVREVAPARGRRAPTLAIETDPCKWGRHRPGAPPRRRPGGDTTKLAEYQWTSTNCGRTPAHPAGVDAPTNCGRTPAHSEERMKNVLLKSEDDAATAEAASSSSLEPSPDVALSDVQRKALASLARFCDPKDSP